MQVVNGIKILSLRDRAQALGEACGGYSKDRYRSWTSVAYALLEMGLNEQEAEAVMRSKWTRWAADHDEHHRYGYHPGYIIADYLWGDGLNRGGTSVADLAEEIVELVVGTEGLTATYDRDEVRDLVARLQKGRAAWMQSRRRRTIKVVK